MVYFRAELGFQNSTYNAHVGHVEDVDTVRCEQIVTEKQNEFFQINQN